MRPLRAFPLGLNVGTDICQISRIYGLLRGPRGRRLVDRILAPEERAQARRDGRLGGGDGAGAEQEKEKEKEAEAEAGAAAARGSSLWRAAAFLAGRFAAKEAAIKAHRRRRLTLHDVVIERLDGGRPVARIRAEGDEAEDASALVSISHDGDYATAVCIAHEPG